MRYTGDFIMKRMLSALLILAVLCTLCACGDNPATDSSATTNTTDTTSVETDTTLSEEPDGIWVTKNYVDEFNDPTYQQYISTNTLLSGTFSNTATTNSKLQAKILVDSVHCSIMLFEYGNKQVKSNVDDEYKISIKYGYKKTDVYGTMNADRIQIYTDKSEVIQALSSGETVTFYIVKSKSKTTTYMFSVESSNFADEYAITILGIDNIDSVATSTEGTTSATEPITATEQKYRDAQTLAFAFKYSEARTLLESVPDYKNATQAISLLENPLYAVFSYKDGGTVHYLWVREQVYFSSLGASEEYETAFTGYSAYKWYEIPSTGSHGTPTRLINTSDKQAESLIMGYYYKWDIADDGKTIAQIEIDQNGNEKGAQYRIVWQRVKIDEQEAAITRANDFLTNN